MAEFTNLRQARKRAARVAKRANGDAAAARHGQTKAEKARLAAEAARARRDLDQHLTQRDEP